MFLFYWVDIREHQRGLLFRNSVFTRMLEPGRHWIVDLRLRTRVERVSVRDVRFDHPDLDVIVRAGALDGEAEVLDLADHQRALVWIDERFDGVYVPCLYALWTSFHRVRTEVIDARAVRFAHDELATVLAAPRPNGVLERVVVQAGWTGLLFLDGRHQETLEPGVYALWQGLGHATVLHVDRRERALDVAGQEIMTGDKVTLRLNAQVRFRIADPLRATSAVDD